MKKGTIHLERLEEFFDVVQELRKSQILLDDLIHKRAGLMSQQTLNSRKLALLVEIGEFANELESFKYWKFNKKIHNNEKIREELIDCFHFFLSIINDLGVELRKINLLNDFLSLDLNQLLLSLFNLTNSISSEFDFNITCNKWVQNFFAICEILQISMSDLLEVYLKKNKLNFDRIINNY